MPAFLSSLTWTDASWLQKRHVKVEGRGSLWRWTCQPGPARRGSCLSQTFLGPCGLRELFFRFPMLRSRRRGY